MNYTYNIPESILENPPTAKLVSVLDGLDRHKKGLIGEYLRYWNPITLNDKKWLVEKLHDFGFSETSEELPMIVLQQVLLNADVIAGTKGSLMGVQLYCSAFSLGDVVITPEKLDFETWNTLMPNDLIRGFVTGDNINTEYYLVSKTEDFLLLGDLHIDVKSRFFKEPIYDGKIDEYGSMVKEDFSTIIYDFLNLNIRNQTIFGAYLDHKIDTLPRDEFYFHELLNKNFI